MISWESVARTDQRPPKGDWTTWLMMGGRGSGKTRAGAEWIQALAEAGHGPFALIAETLADVRDIMVDGVSGLLAIRPPSERPVWTASRRSLEWANGVKALAFSSEDPESLRGPQFAIAWCDELAKWRRPEATWDMLQFALRLGPRPRQIVTTTPRPIPLLKRILADDQTRVSRAKTEANRANLSPAFLKQVVDRYRGTRLGRQELDGEVIEDREDALWKRARLEMCRVDRCPVLTRILVAVDPPAGTSAGADACGMIGAGLGPDGRGYVLADETVQGQSPSGWARRAVALYHRLRADRIVAEVNQGGDMVEAVIRQADRSVPVTKVRANRGKWLRAEPVSALYEQGRISHVGRFSELEDEMCDFGVLGLSSGRSPDRVDALVWALTVLMLQPAGVPRLREM